MLRLGDTIEYLVDVSSPPNQKGIRGQTKIIDREIPLWTAKYLLHSGMVRPFDPTSPLQLEEEETGKDPDVPDKTKKERRIKTDGRRKTNIETDQAGNNGPEKSDSKRRARNRGD